jgi:vancomycin resistance protein YoaR
MRTSFLLRTLFGTEFSMSNPVSVSSSQSLPQSRSSRSPRRMVSVFALSGIIAAAAGLGVVAAVSRPNGRIAPGVRMAGQDLSGKTPEAAQQQIETWAAQFGKVKFALKFAPETGVKRVWKSSANELGLKIDTQATLAKVVGAAQPGVITRVVSLVSPSQQTQDIPPVVTVDNKKLRAVLVQIGTGIKRKAQNARIRFVSGGGFNITREKLGLAMDLDASTQAVNAAWEEFQTTLNQPQTIQPPAPMDETPKTDDTAAKPSGIPTAPIDVELIAKVTQPRVTAELLKQIDLSQPMGKYQTHYGGTGRSRGSNIALATGKIDGTVLAPGEIFSYNQTVGPRIASAGFKDAPVIVKGELVPGIGGGICQVSTTLYNAVLLSDLKIVRRSHHAFPVHYVSPGRDATVVDGAIDFQFQNDTETPIVVLASSSRGRLSFRIFGKRTPGKTVDVVLSGHTTQPVTVRTISDRSLPAGKRVVEDTGHRGHRVTVHRIVKQDGVVTKRELIARDVYRVIPRVVRVGTKPVVTPVAAPTANPDAASPDPVPDAPTEPEVP